MKKLLCIVLALIMVLSMAACGTQSEAPATEAPKADAPAVEAPATEAPAVEAPAGGIVRGGTIKMGKGIVLTNLNPTKVNAQDSDYEIIHQIYENLIVADPSGNLNPGLAESWEVVDDTTIVFYLRQGVKFHDGSDFNAEACKTCMDYYLSEGDANWFQNQLECLESVEIIDDYTVQFNLSKPSSMFLTDITNYVGLMIAPSAIEKGNDWMATNACGTGPFKVGEYVETVSIELLANENYWQMGEDGKPLPYVDSVEITFMTDQTTKVNSLIAGDIHVTDYLVTTGIETLNATEGVNTRAIATSEVYAIFCNVNDEIASNKLVRQAIAYGIDRETLAYAITRGLGGIGTFVSKEGQWFHDPTTPYTYDVEKAKALLAEAGYPDGVTLNMTCISREPDNTVMQVLQEMLKASGINLVLNSMERDEWVALWSKERTGQIGLAKTTVPRVDPYVQIYTNLGAESASNYSNYKGEEFNVLLESLSGIYDTEEQKQVISEAQAAYLEDSATIFLYTLPRYNGYSDKVQNFGTAALGSLEFVNMWIAE